MLNTQFTCGEDSLALLNGKQVKPGREVQGWQFQFAGFEVGSGQVLLVDDLTFNVTD